MDEKTHRMDNKPRILESRFMAPVMATMLCALILSSCSRTTDKSVTVELRDGQTQSLLVSGTRGPGFSGSGSGVQTKLSVRFTRGGVSYTWQRRQVSRQNWVGEPEIVDFVDGDPVVVFPVHRFDECRAYGFPQEGMVAERFNGHVWKKVAISSLPDDMRANWPRSWDRRPKRGTTLTDLVAFYREFDDACAEIHPAPDAERDYSLRRVIKLETESSVLEPQPLPQDGYSSATKDRLYAASRREWTKGHVSTNCAGLIDEIDGFPVVNGVVRGIREIRWVPQTGKRLRFQVPESVLGVFCDMDSVYVATEALGSRTAMVYQLSRGAEIRGAIKLSLENIRAAHSPGTIVSLVRDSDQMYFLWSDEAHCDAVATCRAFAVPWPRATTGAVQ
jgi:hypothetical protein